MFKRLNNDLFKKMSKRLIEQELQAQQNAEEIQKEIDNHKKIMNERRESFSLIRNK